MTAMAGPAGPQTLLVMRTGTFRQLFDADLLDRLSGTARLGEPVYAEDLDDPAALARLAEVEVLLTGWGCPPLTADVLGRAPRLRAVVHAAGSVREHVTEACWDRGIRVSSAVAANAIPVAEYALAAILFAGKRVPTLGTLARTHRSDWSYKHHFGALSNYQRKVGILGFSHTGRLLATLLQPFDLSVMVTDPYADPASVSASGCSLLPLETMLPRCDVLSIHTPLLPSTRNLIGAAELGLLLDGATVVNTSRGGVVDHQALTTECASGRLSAILDVTDPEPLPDASPLYDMPNVLVTPHVAGAVGSETRRLAASAVAEIERMSGDEPWLLHEVTRSDLARIA